jgi:hypothetical protein
MDNDYKTKEVKKYCIQVEKPNYDLHNFDVPFRSLVIDRVEVEKVFF